MKDVLLFLLTHIVDKPEAVSVEESREEDRVILTAHADPADLGKIIGRNGRIIRAIRDLVKLAAIKHNAYVDVVIAEDNKSV